MTTGPRTRKTLKEKIEDRLNDVRQKSQQANRNNRRRASKLYPESNPNKPKVNYFTWKNLLYGAVIVIPAFNLLGYVYHFTAGLYVDTFASLGQATDVVQIDITSRFVEAIPLIGPLLNAPFYWVENFLNGLQTSSLGMAGLVTYLILQTGELIPTVIWESPEIMWFLITAFDSHKKVAFSKQDNEAIKRIKIQHNEYYDSFLNSLEDFRQVCYIIDVLICFFLVRFVRVGTPENYVLERFPKAATELTFGLWDLDPIAVLRMLCSLFLLWVGVKFAMRLTHGFRFFAKREKKDV